MITFINRGQMELGLGQAEAEQEPAAVLVLAVVLEAVIVLHEPVGIAQAAETAQSVLHLLHHLDEHQQLILELATKVLEEGILVACELKIQI